MGGIMSSETIALEPDQRLSLLGQVTAAWGGTLERSELLPLVASRTAEALHAAAAAVLLANSQGQLVVAAAAGLPASIQDQVLVEVGVGVCGWVAREDALLFVRDLSADPRLSPTERHWFVEAQGLRTLVGAPLHAERKVSGLLAAFHFCPQEIHERDLQMLSMMATQASIALDNARLYEEQVQRNVELRTLGEIGRSLWSMLDSTPLLNRILSVSTDIIGSERGYLLRLDEAQRELRLVASRGLSRTQVENFHLALGQGLAGWVAESGEPLLTNEAEQDPRYLDLGVGAAESVLCVPLKSRGRLIGVLHLENKLDPGGFTPDDLNLLTALSSQAAIAIDNAELYAHLEERVAQAHRDLIAANRQLGQRNAEIEAMVESMGDGVVVIDPDHHLRLINAAARRMLGLDQRPVEGLLFPEQVLAPEVTGALAELLRQPNGAATGEVALEESGRPKVLSVQAAPVHDEQGQPLGRVIVLTDVTHLKELDRIKTELISFVSHELRTPLTSIMGYSSTLMHSGAKLSPEIQQECLQTIVQECDRLNRLTIDLLDITRIESGRSLELQCRAVDLPPLIQRVIQSQKALIQGHTFDVRLAPDATTIVADEDKLEQILVNLVNNAIKYSPQGGTVTVAATREGRDIRLRVADEGLGIPADQLPIIFNQYHRARSSPNIQGIGIGLYLVRHLVEAHGGRIWAESKVGRGSQFTFTLPQPMSGTGGE